MTGGIDGEQYALLERLADHPATSEALAEDLDVPRETIHSHIRQLRSAGFVRRGRRGGHTTYLITYAGRQEIDR